MPTSAEPIDSPDTPDTSNAGQTPGHPRPRRAEPLQPDLPGRGLQQETAPASGDTHGTLGQDEPAKHSGAAADAQTAQQAEQSKAALDNVSKGYD